MAGKSVEMMEMKMKLLSVEMKVVPTTMAERMACYLVEQTVDMLVTMTDC